MSRRDSPSSTWRIVACVAGILGMKTVQQSACAWMEMSYVPMRRASAMISFLSMPMSGRSTGTVAAASTAATFSSVCDATWPRLSPVTSARAFSRRAISSATRTIMRR